MLVEANLTTDLAKRARVAEQFLIDGDRLDGNVTGRLTGARLKHTMEGASSIELTIDDSDLKLLRSGVLARPGKPNKRAAAAGLDLAAWDRFGTARLTLDGAFFRLAGVSGHYGTGERVITVTFEDEIAALMRHRTEAIKFGRSVFTRSEAIHVAVRRTMRLSHVRFGYFSPQEGQRQKIAEPDVDQAKKGIHPDKHLTIKGNTIRAEQRRNIETSLGVADGEGAGERATLAMLVAGIGESGFLAIPNAAGSNYWGVFQGSKDVWKLTDTEGMARSFLLGGKGFQAGGAIDYAAKHPDATPGEIATKVEASGQPGAFYDEWKTEAAAILDARGGVNQIHEIRERFEFRFGGRKDGQKRNWWDDTGDMADQVRWRRFANANILWFVNDEWLFSRRPMYVVAPDSDGLLDISFDADVGMPVAEINLTARAARWTTPPGAVFDLDDFGPLSGRWLCWTSDEDLFTGQVDIVLHRPAPQKKEPAPTTRTVTTTEETPEAGSVRAEIVRMARRALRLRPRYRYQQIRPMPDTLFPTDLPHGPGGSLAQRTVHIDCSAFVTLIYKAAGAPDPNGKGYDGFGYTGTLVANGTKTTDPQPGDLVFYGSAPPYDHVGIYIGDGKVIEMGGTPGPLELKTRYRSDFAGYWTYDLESA